MLKTALVISFLFFLQGLVMAVGSITQTAAGPGPTAGCPDTFTTSITGQVYSWVFPAGCIPLKSYNTTGKSSASTVFTIPGSYWVYVTVDSSLTDSLSVTVSASNETVSLTQNVNKACQQSVIQFAASPPGYDRYSFFVNDSLVQFFGQDTLRIGLNPGDSVWVMGYSGVCYTARSNALRPVIYPTPAMPVLTSSAPNDTICGGDTITFTATPGYDTYNFYNNAASQTGPVSSNIFITTQLSPGNQIYAVATQNGCSSPPSNRIRTSVPSPPIVELPFELSICQGGVFSIAPEVFYYGQSNTLQNYSYYVNDSLVQSGPDSLFIDSTLKNDDQIVVSVNSGTCVAWSDPLLVTYNSPLDVYINTYSYNNLLCLGQNLQFTSEAIPYGTYNYQWFRNGIALGTNSYNFESNQLKNNDSVWAVANSPGCPAADGVKSNVIYLTAVVAPYQQLCTISYDVNSGYNLLVWDNANLQASKNFFIYRSDIQDPNYRLLGAANLSFYGEYIDSTSQPELFSYRYKMNLVDICGDSSALSNYIQTMFLQYSGNGNFTWTPYIVENAGFTGVGYDFYRDKNGNGASWELMESLPSTQTTFTDAGYNLFPDAKYMVVVQLDSSCNNTGIYSSVSNIVATNNPLFITFEKLQKVHVVANPLHNQFVLSNLTEPAQIELMDISGQLLRGNMKTSSSFYTIDMSAFAAGMYLIKVSMGGGHVILKASRY